MRPPHILLRRALIATAILIGLTGSSCSQHDHTTPATRGTPLERPSTTTTTTSAPSTTTRPAPTTLPATTTTTAPPIAPHGDVEAAIRAAFPDIYQQAYGVAHCESTLNPTAVSAGGANWGLFQINRVHRARVEALGYRWAQILDPYVNAAVARAIYNEQGWAPWACRWAAHN